MRSTARWTRGVDPLTRLRLDHGMSSSLPGAPMNMIRKQFLSDEAQNRRLKQLASETGKSEAELIRESVAARIGDAIAPSDDWRTGLTRLSGAWSERADMHEFVEDLRKGWGKRAQRRGLSGENN